MDLLSAEYFIYIYTYNLILEFLVDLIICCNSAMVPVLTHSVTVMNSNIFLGQKSGFHAGLLTFGKSLYLRT